MPGRIPWLEWNDETARLLEERDKPILLFVADPGNAALWPFLREILRAMEENPRLPGLLREEFPALLVHGDSLPEALAGLGAGSSYHIAILSPVGFTPMATTDPVHGNPGEVVEELVKALEALRGTWK